MSISSIVQIADRLLNGNFGQNPETQSKNKATQGAGQGQSNRTEFGDRFTHSEQADSANAAGGAGLLQVEQLRFTALNIQTPAGNTVATPPAAPAVQPATTAATTPGVAQTQSDLQTLNSALAGLGLNAAEIAAFDQFATILLQFNPNALRDLENQLNLLASRYQTQNAPATGAAAQTPATSPGFQLTELSVSFNGLNGTLSQGAQNGGNAAAVQFSAFNLQIQEVRVTLSNSAGQTAQLTVPQAGNSAATPVAQSAKA